MKKNLLILFLVFMQTGYLFAQDSNDQTAILQLCVDLPELQEFYQGDQLFFMVHGVELSNEIELFYKGVKVEFYDKNGIKSLGVSNFFLLWQFYIKDNSAKIVGQYVLNSESDNENSVPFELTLEKNENSWQIIEFGIK